MGYEKVRKGSELIQEGLELLLISANYLELCGCYNPSGFAMEGNTICQRHLNTKSSN